MEAVGMNGDRKDDGVAVAAGRWLRAEYLPRLRACRALGSGGVFPGGGGVPSGGGVIAEGGAVDGWPGCQFNERFLQIIWNERHLAPALTTVSGQALQVISPGVWNVSGGPDFRGASLVIAGRLLHGDVEIHRRSSDWQRHGHQQDPAYNGVILHAV